MENFISRKVEIKTSMFEVSRYRDSNGRCYIRIEALYNKIFTIHISTDNFSEKYEEVAYELIEALEKIINEPCLLPKLDNKE